LLKSALEYARLKLSVFPVFVKAGALHMPDISIAPVLIPVTEVARLLGISRASVYNLDRQGALPAPIHLNKSVRWNRQELLDYIEALTREGKPISRHRWNQMRGNKL
jgi:excisionase family DNA binding protein